MRCDFFRGLLMSCLDVRSNKVMMHSSAWNRRKHYGNQPAWQRPHDSAYPRKLQLASGSNRTLAKLYGLNPKTVAKWRASTSVLDEPMVLGTEQASIFLKSKNTWQLHYASKGICRRTIS